LAGADYEEGEGFCSREGGLGAFCGMCLVSTVVNFDGRMEYVFIIILKAVCERETAALTGHPLFHGIKQGILGTR
jgi:hypothetical protein